MRVAAWAHELAGMLKLNQVEETVEASRKDISERVEIEYRESVRREAMVKQAVAEAKAEFDRVNARSFEYQALKREAEADKNLYEELVRKIKEAGINAGFQNSAIRIADPARPALKPVFPNAGLNALLAFLFSALVAMAVAVVSDVLDKTIRDLIDNEDMTIEDAYEDTVQVIVEADKLQRRTDNMVKSFERLMKKAHNADERSRIKTIGRSLINRVKALIA